MRNNSRPVYSCEAGRLCPNCGKPVPECSCSHKKAPAGNDGVVRIHRETKGRKGKGVTLISGVPLKGEELKKLAKALKQKCGSGGTLKNGVIEIQGEHRDTVFAELKNKGWQVKKAGG